MPRTRRMPSAAAPEGAPGRLSRNSRNGRPVTGWKEVREIGAETLVTACPWCKNNFDQAVKTGGEAVQVRDIAEVICAALEA